jgi:hypothetical protein
VECALKSCIAKNTRKGEFPDLDLARQSFTHRIDELARVAGLVPAFRARVRDNLDFRDNWELVVLWRESSRYAKRSRQEARDLLGAISDNHNGVLPWIATFW